jgi:predicted N-formylglutamate amidohydrolase
MDSVLAEEEGPAVEIREGEGPFIIVCEHASNVVPRSLGTLGLVPIDLERHIAWDPGAREVAAGIAARLDATLVLQRFSRLAIDCNRDPDLPDAIIVRSEYTDVPGNMGLSPEAREGRIRSIWSPFHHALDRLIGNRREAAVRTMLVTVHTFTPVFRGISRPWHVGIISTEERGLADALLQDLRGETALVVGDNEPYSAKDNVDYTIRRHGKERGLPHVMIEIRNDLVADGEGQAAWAERVARHLDAFDMAERAA